MRTTSKSPTTPARGSNITGTYPTQLVRGKFATYADTSDETIVYGFTDMQYYDPTAKEWRNLPDMFTVTADTFELARSEFWQRWAIYRRKRFPRTFVKLEYVESDRSDTKFST